MKGVETDLVRNGHLHVKIQSALLKFTKFFHTSSKTSHTYDLNRGLVLGLRLIGRGHSAAERLMSVNLSRPITKNPWALHTRVLDKAAGELLVKGLSNAAKEVKEFKFFNGLISSAERQEDKTIDVGVSIDGSWSSGGWTARDGVVAVVLIDTGKVLDVVYLSNSCTACQRKEREKNEGTISTID